MYMVHQDSSIKILLISDKIAQVKEIRLKHQSEPQESVKIVEKIQNIDYCINTNFIPL